MKKFYFFIALALLPLITMCSDPYSHMMGGWNHPENNGGSSGFGYGGIVMGILFLIILGAVSYFIVHNIKLKKGTREATESPLDVLKKRYAKGEITKEEFDQIKNELE